MAVRESSLKRELIIRDDAHKEETHLTPSGGLSEADGFWKSAGYNGAIVGGQDDVGGISDSLATFGYGV